MVDLLDGSAFDVRFGIADDRLRSLSFKVRKDKKGDIYVTCRECSGGKLSFHQSGVHHYADVSTKHGQRRRTIAKSTLMRPNKNDVLTIARVLFTTTTDWTVDRGDVPKDFLKLPPCSSESLVHVSIAIADHDPLKNPETRSVPPDAVIEVENNKFVVIATQNISQNAFSQIAYYKCAIHPNSYFEFDLFERDSIHRIYDQVANFKSNLNTYMLWAHHNITSESKRWFRRHQISRPMLDARFDIIAGNYTGDTLDESLRRRSPDWLQQVADAQRRAAEYRRKSK